MTVMHDESAVGLTETY